MTKKKLVNPKAHMVIVPQKWNKITKELQKLIHVREPRTKKICKRKQNKLNYDFKKLANYPKGIKHIPLVWELTIEECNNKHLPC